ncbi:MAG TPA: ATP synthase F0 subunit C [Fimbriimonadaceae bacterium]|nr:ATP synthase F0 subunit C [Fimbriimonadaceae bacterium]
MNIAIGIGLAVGIAGLGVGIGQGLATNGGLNGMSRQPEAAKQINNSMLLGLVFLELVFLLSFVLGFLMMGKIPAANAAGAASGMRIESKSHVASNVPSDTPNLSVPE